LRISTSMRCHSVWVVRGVSLITAAVHSFPVVPIKRLRAVGVAVACGDDGIRDLWGRFGSGAPLERAMHVAYRSTFRRDENIEPASQPRHTGAPSCWASSSTA
jgi:cytosine/creatinine deaminase